MRTWEHGSRAVYWQCFSDQWWTEIQQQDESRQWSVIMTDHSFAGLLLNPENLTSSPHTHALHTRIIIRRLGKSQLVTKLFVLDNARSGYLLLVRSSKYILKFIWSEDVQSWNIDNWTCPWFLRMVCRQRELDCNVLRMTWTWKVAGLRERKKA